MVDEHAGLGLLELVPAGQPGLLGQEARDRQRLADLLPVVVKDGECAQRSV